MFRPTGGEQPSPNSTLIRRSSLTTLINLIILAVFAAAGSITAAGQITVTPDNLQGWAPSTSDGGSVSFDALAGAPSGSGALRLTAGATNESRARLTRSTHAPIASVNSLSFWSKSIGGSAYAAPSYSIGVYLDGTPATFTNFVFEPYWADGTGGPEPVQQGVWQHWDVAAIGNLWSSSTRNAGGSCMTTAGAGGPPFYSLAWIKANCPNAVVVNFSTYVGSYNPSFDVLVDLFNFNGTAFNMEAAATTIEQIRASDLTNTPNYDDWFFYQDRSDIEGIDNGLGTFVGGPAVPFYGAGSAQISTSGTSRPNIATYQFASTPLDEITELKFSTYNPSAGNGGSASRSGYLNFNVSFDGADTWQRRLVYVPSDNGTVMQNTWQTWDAIADGTALWQYSGPTWPAGIGGGGEPGTTTKTWSQILAQYPDAQIRDSDSWLGVRVGEPYADGYTENIDHFVFGTTTGGTTIFDFEPDALVVDDDLACPGATYSTIQAAIDAATVGATIQVCPGTYNENVHINKAGIKLIGPKAGVAAGAATPTNRGTDEAVIVGAAGPSGAVRVTANGVTVDGFTVHAHSSSGQSGFNFAAANHTFVNNIIDGTQQGPHSGGSFNSSFFGGSVNNMRIENNRMSGHLYGMYLDGGPSAGTVFASNYFTGNGNGVVLSGSIANGLSFIGNTFDGNGTALILAQGGHMVMNNVFRNSTSAASSAVYLFPTARTYGVVVSGNIISNYGYGIRALAGTTNPPAGSVHTVIGNSFSGIASQIIRNENAVMHIDASGNWMESADPSAAEAEISGSADFSPMLTSGSDQSTAVGFQADLSSLRVHTLGTQTGTTSRIQEGHNLVASGGTVSVLGGTYDGDVNTAGKATTLSPGASPAQVVINGNLTMDSDDTLEIEIQGTSPSSPAMFDNLAVNGTVDLGGATLELQPSFTPTVGTTFRIIDNDGSDSVTGTFAGLPEGATINLGSTQYTISYTAGTGNDVVLTATVVDCNNISVSTGITTLRNQQVVVPIMVDDLTGRGVFTSDYTFTYDPSVLSYVGNDVAGTVADGSTITVNNNTPGTLVVSVFNGNSDFTGSGVFMNIRFMAAGPIGSTSGIDFTGFIFNNGVPCVNTTNGSVEIISSTVSGQVEYVNSPTMKLVPGAVLTGVGVSGPTVSDTTDINGEYELDGFGAGAYTVTPSKSGDVNGITSFDAGQVARHTVGLITLNSTQLLAADVSQDSIVNSFDAGNIARFIVGNPSHQSTGQWRFLPASRNYSNLETAQPNQDYDAILLGEVDGSWTPVSPLAEFMPERPETKDDIRFIAPRTNSSPGSEIVIPIAVENMSSKGVFDYQFELRFDPNVLEASHNAAIAEGTLSEGHSVVSYSPEPGLVKVSVFGTMPLETDGTLLNVRLNVIGSEGSTSGLTLSGTLAGDGTHRVIPVSGSLNVESAAGATINGTLYTAGGMPVAKGRVVLTDSNGNTRTALSGPWGTFEFGGLESGSRYTISVQGGRHTFEPRTVTVDGELTIVNMIAIQ